MLKVYQNDSQIEKIYKKIAEYIKKEKKLPNNSFIKEPSRNEMVNCQNGGCVGEIEFNKILPNGNNQKRLVTAYNDGSIGIATSITSPCGELLQAYYGIRDRSWKAIQPETGNIVKVNPGTIEYDSGLSMNVLSKAISRIYK